MAIPTLAEVVALFGCSLSVTFVAWV